MILKYKLENGSWRFVTLNDFTVGKVDITEVYNKYLDKETGKVNLSYCSSGDSGGWEIRKLFDNVSYYDDSTKSNISRILYDEKVINKYMHYIVVSYNEGNCLVLYDEAYLMSDEGKTIEKLM
jgi:hypothetical protein